MTRTFLRGSEPYSECLRMPQATAGTEDPQAGFPGGPSFLPATRGKPARALPAGP